MTENQKIFKKDFLKRSKEIKFEYKEFDEEFKGQLLIESYKNLKDLHLLSVLSIKKLTLKNLKNLETCTVRCCGMKELVIENCPKIEKLNVRNNNLTDLDFLESLKNLNWEKFDLDISYNDFSLSDLDPFRGITNLCKLDISDSLRRRIFFRKGCVCFYGSLKLLKNNSILKELDISNTDINRGLEDLPESLKRMACSAGWLPRKEWRSKCSEIAQRLQGHRISGSNYYDIDGWRGDPHYHRQFVRINEELPKEIFALLSELEIKQKKEKLLERLTINITLNKNIHMKKNQNTQGIVSKSGNVKVGNFSLSDNKIQSNTDAENTQGIMAAFDAEVTGDFSMEGNEIINQIIAQEQGNKNLAHKTILEGIDIAPFIPISLHESLKKGDKLEENYNLKKEEEISYDKVEGETDKTNHWTLPQSLPFRLYDINEEKIIEVKKDANIDQYAILSYSWGGKAEEDINWSLENAEKRLSPGGKKSFAKVTEACRELRIDYIWIDQLCINQNEKTPEEIAEMNQEVPKMRQYYSNAAVTLISIQRKLREKDIDNLSPIEIIGMIIKSEWFSRSWCFQEGWLSKHTIFMFDDVLVDGRELAATWVLHQPGYSDYVTGKLEEISNYSAKVATPLGWVYHKDGYNSEDKVSLSLSQALRGIKERGRAWPIDGIYSILGLLPYGEKVQPKYEAWGHKYTKEELEKALLDVVKTAWENGYAELLAWHGEGDDLLPNIIDSDKCLTNVAGGIFIKRKESNLESIITSFTSESLKINSSEYIIDSITSGLSEIESKEGFLIDGGLCVREVRVKIDNKNDREEIKLWGTRESLEKMKKGNSLIVPNKNEWESNIPFAILASRKGKFYHRIGLVELRSEAEKLVGNKERKLMFKINEQAQVVQVEQPAK